MKWLHEHRGQNVREDPRLRLGIVRFVPELKAAEMSQETWDLINRDEALQRTYTTTRARAMRSNQSTMLSLLGKATGATTVTLEELDSRMEALLTALRAIEGSTESSSADLLRRRQAVRSLLDQVEERVDLARARLEIVEELLEAKVLS